MARGPEPGLPVFGQPTLSFYVVLQPEPKCTIPNRWVNRLTEWDIFRKAPSQKRWRLFTTTLESAGAHQPQRHRKPQSLVTGKRARCLEGTGC